MAEQHRIVGPAHGEPQLADLVGARVRVPLDGPPSPRWSSAMTAHLAVGLTGHPAVGHLRLGHVIQGADIVLEGVESREATLLGPALQRAIDAANRTCARARDGERVAALNMEPAQAEAVARAVTGTRFDEASTGPAPAV